MVAAIFGSLFAGCVAPTHSTPRADDTAASPGCLSPSWIDDDGAAGSAGTWSRFGSIDSTVGSCALDRPGDGRTLAVSSSTYAVFRDDDWDKDSFFGQAGIAGAFLDVAGGAGDEAWFTFNDFDDDVVRVVSWDGRAFAHWSLPDLDFGTDARVVVDGGGDAHGFGVGGGHLFHFWPGGGEGDAEPVDLGVLGAVDATAHEEVAYVAYVLGGLVALAEGTPGNWSRGYVASDEVATSSLAGLALAVDACGTPVVAWPNAQGEARIAARDGRDWVVGTLDDDNDGTRPAVTVTSEGEIVAVFPGIDGNSKVFRNGGDGWARADLDQFAEPGDHACVDLAADDNGGLAAAVYTTASGLVVYAGE